MDTDTGSELFSSYEAELKLVQADLNQKLDQISDLSGEPRKSMVRLAERALEDANDLVSTNPDLLTIRPNGMTDCIPHSWTKCALRSKTSLPPHAPE